MSAEVPSLSTVTPLLRSFLIISISFLVSSTFKMAMFICSVTEARVISDKETMTYSYYHANVKPKPETEGKKGWVCKICGYVYEGDPLPEDFICPLCKHGAADFEPIQ